MHTATLQNTPHRTADAREMKMAGLALVSRELSIFKQ